MAEKRYSFDGEMVTPAELARRVTMFSKSWLGEALRAGCRSVPDLHAYARRRQSNQRKGNLLGSKKTRRLHPGWNAQVTADQQMLLVGDRKTPGARSKTDEPSD